MPEDLGRDGIPDAIRKARHVTRKTWARAPTLTHFLRDHAPAQWEAIQTCSLDYNIKQDPHNPKLYKIQPKRCHKIPWCIICTQYKHFIRVLNHLNKLSECTPKGQQIHTLHIVQTAPIYDHGLNPKEGWGVDASNNLDAWFQIVWKTLLDAYGPGIGAILNYQDYGEQIFHKRHPHIDLVLNGWTIQGKDAQAIQEYNLKDHGYEKFQNQLLQNAQQHWPTNGKHGNLRIKPRKPSTALARQVLDYSSREIIDFRKMRYNHETQQVAWHNYKTNDWNLMDVHQTLAGFTEYEMRLGVFESNRAYGIDNDDEADNNTQNQLHRAFGHMSNKLLHKTSANIGGTPLPHNQDCICSQCRDWQLVILDDVDREIGKAPPINWRRPMD
ncbi:MAG TPA: hypothetical protein VM286_06265 [Candidatus Thermoplasmatota archaeon]|nr:hypothetical protein [Candidatus Thermoplasmatota archaeon]